MSLVQDSSPPLKRKQQVSRQLQFTPSEHSDDGLHGDASGDGGISISGDEFDPHENADIVAGLRQRAPTVTKSTDKFHSRASLATYSIKQYALENVQRVKRGFLFKKEVSQDVVMSHSSDTTLTTPLSVRVPSELGAAAVHCFRNVTAFMGERKSKRPKLSHAQVLIDLGLREKTLREELFLQVIKQTTGNPDPAAAREGWTLLVFFCSVFLPTKEFCHYLSVYIEHTSKSDPALQEVAVFCRQQFTDTMKFGTRKNAPQMEELQALAQLRKTIDVRIELPGAFFVPQASSDTELTHVTVPVWAHMRVADVVYKVATEELKMLGKPELTTFGESETLCWGISEVWGDARGTGPTLDLRSETQEVLSYSSAVGTVTEINALDSESAFMDHVSRGQAFLAANRTHTKHKHWRVAYVIRPRHHDEQLFSLYHTRALALFYHDALYEVLYGVYQPSDERMAGELAALALLQAHRSEGEAELTLRSSLPLFFPIEFSFQWRKVPWYSSTYKLTQRGKHLVGAIMALYREYKAGLERMEEKQRSKVLMSNYLARVVALDNYGITTVRATQTAVVVNAPHITRVISDGETPHLAPDDNLLTKPVQVQVGLSPEGLCILGLDNETKQSYPTHALVFASCVEDESGTAGCVRVVGVAEDNALVLHTFSVNWQSCQLIVRHVLRLCDEREAYERQADVNAEEEAMLMPSPVLLPPPALPLDAYDDI